MKRVLFAAFLFCFISAYAKKEEIPEELMNAKTAIVGNSGAEAKDFTKLCKLLKEWGRFELVEEQEKADIVITISTRLETRTVRMPSVSGGIGGLNSQQVLISTLRIMNARNGAELWTDETVTQSKDPKQFVSKLKSKLKKKK